MSKKIKTYLVPVTATFDGFVEVSAESKHDAEYAAQDLVHDFLEGLGEDDQHNTVLATVGRAYKKSILD